MSVVVRMEMPKGCGSCTIANFGYCSINHKQVGDPLMGYPENRPANCPILCQLPEGHGRLIDADAMADDVRSLWDYKTVDGITASTVLKQIMTDIGNCPTIVPAEAERSEP